MQIIIATRESPLALWQAEHIAAELKKANPDCEPTLLGMTTKGDQWLSSPLSEVGGKGLFVKELEQAMLDGRAHIAVHSCKDLPAELPDGFELIATGYRADVRDAFVSPRYASFAELPQGAVVGTSSLRRGVQLLARRPDLVLKPVRGNVGTRLGKLDAGEYDALILAAAGLERLELGERIRERFEPSDSLPAAGQGALSIECHETLSSELRALVGALHDSKIAAQVAAERAVSAGLGADCSLPVAAYASGDGETMMLDALVGALPTETEPARIERVHVAARNLSDTAALGQQAAEDLLKAGAQSILDAARHA
ncbi:MAG: hydroxymethylbilane synthase [Pseudomonadota bacterium]